MTSVQIHTLLQPPHVPDANHNAVFLINSRFQSLDDLDGLENAVLEAKQRDEQLKANVRPSSLYFGHTFIKCRSIAYNISSKHRCTRLPDPGRRTNTYENSPEPFSATSFSRR
jgi:hypothetical protein